MKYIITLLLLIYGHIGAAQIKSYNESASYFKQPTQIDTSRGNFSTKDMYRAYRRAGTGFTSMTKTQRKLEKRIRQFAKSKGKSFVVLGSQFSQPPYIFGNYPRMEIIFVLIDQ